jgi:hypothetical protein
MQQLAGAASEVLSMATKNARRTMWRSLATAAACRILLTSTAASSVNSLQAPAGCAPAAMNRKAYGAVKAMPSVHQLVSKDNCWLLTGSVHAADHSVAASARHAQLDVTGCAAARSSRLRQCRLCVVATTHRQALSGWQMKVMTQPAWH